MQIMQTHYETFDAFYVDYLKEHEDPTSRRLHFVGTSLSFALAAVAIATYQWWLLALAFAQGYVWAWVGHFFFEKNKPASFKHPWLSYKGDMRMWWEILTGKIPF